MSTYNDELQGANDYHKGMLAEADRARLAREVTRPGSATARAGRLLIRAGDKLADWGTTLETRTQEKRQPQTG